MRMLFTAATCRPHVFPLAALAWACRVAGHDVRLAGAPDATDDMVHTGLPTVVVGGAAVRRDHGRTAFFSSIHPQERWPAGWPANQRLLDERQREHLADVGEAVIAGADAVLDDLVAFGRAWRPDVVVHDACGYAGVVTAAVLGVPAVRHLSGAASSPRVELSGGRLLPSYVRMFERFDVDAATEAALTIEPTPPSMRLTCPEGPWLPVRYLPYSGCGQDFRWPAEPRQRPRICVTWGRTMARALGGAAAGPYRQVIDAISTLDLDVVVVAGRAQLGLLGELPAAVVAARSTPLHLVLPHCDAIVQQGSDGATLTAASLGLPQLAVSRNPDAEPGPDRLATLGVGIHLPYRELRGNPHGPDLVRAAVDKLLVDPGYRAAAERLREEIADQPPPAALVPALTEL